MNNLFLTRQNNNQQDIYGDLMRMRGMPSSPSPIAYRTVFNDIADEWGNCTEEERKFIDSDADYVNANLRYQQQFNAFLLDMVGAQFINSAYGKSAEEVLLALRQARGRYRSKTAEVASSIQDENRILRAEIEKLKEVINERQGNNL